jgi:dUTPase
MNVLKVMLLREGAKVPKRGSAASAGYDVYAYLPDVEDGLTIQPHSRELVPTALAIEIGHGYFAYMASRSGLAAGKLLAHRISSCEISIRQSGSEGCDAAFARTRSASCNAVDHLAQSRRTALSR